jgi:hypothetical protein
LKQRYYAGGVWTKHGQVAQHSQVVGAAAAG